MPVVIVLFGSWILFRGLGALGVSAFHTWHESVRYALAAMFVFTGSAHFMRIKNDLARMIPEVFPHPMLIVYVTGVLEILGAAGLLLPEFRAAASLCLILLLIGMFCANVNAAVKGMTLGGKPVTPLWIRTPMQVVFIALLWWAKG